MGSPPKAYRTGLGSRPDGYRGDRGQQRAFRFLGFHALARKTSCTLGGSAHNGDLDGYAKPYLRNTDTSRIVRAWNYRSARYDLQNSHRPL